MAAFCYTEEALLPVPQADSGVLVISYERDGGCRSHSCWWDDLHLEYHFAPNDRPASPGKEGSQEKPRIKDNDKIMGLHTFPQHFPHPHLTVSCSKDCDILNGPYTTIDTPVRNGTANLRLTFFLSQRKLNHYSRLNDFS